MPLWCPNQSTSVFVSHWKHLSFIFCVGIKHLQRSQFQKFWGSGIQFISPFLTYRKCVTGKGDLAQNMNPLLHHTVGPIIKAIVYIVVHSWATANVRTGAQSAGGSICGLLRDVTAVFAVPAAAIGIIALSRTLPSARWCCLRPVDLSLPLPPGGVWVGADSLAKRQRERILTNSCWEGVKIANNGRRSGTNVELLVVVMRMHIISGVPCKDCT